MERGEDVRGEGRAKAAVAARKAHIREACRHGADRRIVGDDQAHEDARRHHDVLRAYNKPACSVGRNIHHKLIARTRNAQPVAVLAWELLRICLPVGSSAELAAAQIAQIGHQLRLFGVGVFVFAHHDARPAGGDRTDVGNQSCDAAVAAQGTLRKSLTIVSEAWPVEAVYARNRENAAGRIVGNAVAVGTAHAIRVLAPAAGQAAYCDVGGTSSCIVAQVSYGNGNGYRLAQLLAGDARSTQHDALNTAVIVSSH